MYIFDTNVVSELRRPEKANAKVRSFAESISHSGIFLSVITVLELELGMLRIERKDEAQGAIFRTWIEKQILPRFHGRILAIDAAVATVCAKLHVPDPRAERDAFIAATALVHAMTIVTRNTADFAATGAKIFNPWGGLPARG